MKYKSNQDLSSLEKYMEQLTELSGKVVEYGFFDDPHYSGLNTATLAAIHEEGWNKLPERNFMYSTSLLYRDGIEKHIRNMHSAISQSKSFMPYLDKIGSDGADSVRLTIQEGSFQNPKVSKDWAAIKGFDDALVHFGDLGSSARYEVGKLSKSGS